MFSLRTFAAALLPAAFLILGAVQVAIADNRIDEVEGGQLIALAAGPVFQYFLPLLPGKWAGGLKTGFAVLAAIATLIIPLVIGFTWQALVLVGLAAVQALATEIGVQLRKPSTGNGGSLRAASPTPIPHPPA